MRSHRRPLLTLTFFILTLASPGFAHAAAPTLRSLNDLPRNWSGEAGDLFNRVQATLRLGNATERSRVGDDQRFRAEYDVKGAFTVGNRSYPITKAQVFVSDITSNRAEIVFQVKDALVSNLYVLVRHRPETQDFELLDLTQRGGAERRFVLHAPEEVRR